MNELLSSNKQSAWDCEPENHFTALHYVAACSREGGSLPVQAAETLLNFGADVHQLDKSFHSPLMIAVSGDNKGN